MDDSGNPLASLLLPVLLLVAFYLLIIRPQRARSKAVQQVQARIGAGSQVITTSGLYAEVVEVEDTTLLLEVAPGITNRYSRAAVATVVSSGDELDPDPDPDPEPEPEPDPEPRAEPRLDARPDVGPGTGPDTRPANGPDDTGDEPPRERPAV